MKLTVFSLLFAIAFLSDSSIKSEALPLDNIEDIDLIQDSTGEGLAENTVGSGPGISKIIRVADIDLLRMLKALERNMPERILSPDRRDGSPDLGPSISIIRRDTKRCMVGRVYRPCWEV
ncbi:pro-melanin-concentrating hormone, like [Pangasianodon hypophthalmus]|uniref:pro-melanin-concentrating hormone, like n=1 Tax=Pangasianodon hypophthalmus TaxID=310915 RepID=UPI000EFE338E|nr:pro-melanin-concentrating hormone, like [Pangasianodon hypophthalmus]